ENPFDSEGEGTIRLHTVVNSITTRADDDPSTSDPMQEYKDKCIVYISGEKGLIYKKVGLHNVDETITLKTGHYAAEAWTGDSVAASFDKKFFRGYESFEVTKGSQQNIALTCKIQNVVASINTSTIDPNLMNDDYSISIKNSRGEIVFNKDNAPSERAYFMMPDGDTTLEYTISGTRQDGKPFTKSGSIDGVQRAHHYILNFEYNPEGQGQNPSTSGAVFLKIIIKDEDIHDSQSVTVHSRPTITGVDFKIDKQQVYTSDADIPESLNVQLCGFKGLKELAVTSHSASELGIPTDSINLFEADASRLQPYKDAGLVWTAPEYNGKTDVSTAYLTIPKNMIERLSTTKTTEHEIRITIKDGDTNPKTHSATIRIARNDIAIKMEDPIVLDKVDQDTDCLSTTPYSFTIPFTLSDEVEGTPGVEYSKADEDNWTFVPATVPSKAPRKFAVTRAQQKYTVTITGLEPGTNYKYRGACGDFHSDKVMTFTTESKFVIPDASFEKWSSYQASTMLGTKTVTLPGNTGDKETSFWGSGNEGSATANLTLTDKSTDMKHSGQYSARLGSNAAMGVIAAGNIFTGKYVRTDGTNGVLSVGRPYNGSHPAKLKVFANYRPGSGVTINDKNKDFLPANFAGGTDHGQIYVALTTEEVEIRTNPKDRKLFESNDPVVLAYGQVTWTGNFGPDGQLQEIEIPLEYNDRAKKAKPTHLVIVCSASKYGDYFSGSKNSVMYVDDFELIYE
ncbi:MAG: PCMD domain-containing protein, partial [Muribaculaceae bacterium]|nr:PCMD domain-containing protein [Muribaculaceae bacterium]